MMSASLAGSTTAADALAGNHAVDDVATADSDEVAALAALFGAERPAARLVQSFGGIFNIARASDLELMAAGLNSARVARLRAALEVGAFAMAAPLKGRPLGSAGEVAQRYRVKLSHHDVEEFWALALDTRNRVTDELMLARGCLSGVEVHPRDIFRSLIRVGAASTIFVHNHPSGDPSPSAQDIDLTARLRDVGKLCGITVMDHVVVGIEGYASLSERGWR